MKPSENRQVTKYSLLRYILRTIFMPFMFFSHWYHKQLEAQGAK